MCIQLLDPWHILHLNLAWKCMKCKQKSTIKVTMGCGYEEYYELQLITSNRSCIQPIEPQQFTICFALKFSSEMYGMQAQTWFQATTSYRHHSVQIQWVTTYYNILVKSHVYTTTCILSNFNCFAPKFSRNTWNESTNLISSYNGVQTSQHVGTRSTMGYNRLQQISQVSCVYNHLNPSKFPSIWHLNSAQICMKCNQETDFKL